MITMGGFQLPTKTIREMIVGSIDVIIQAERLRDGSRRITKITEVVGTEGDVVITQDLLTYEIPAKTKPAASRASMSAPASCARISGNAPATTIWSANWPRRSTPFSREAAMGLAIIVMFLVLAGGGGYFAYADGDRPFRQARDGDRQAAGLGPRRQGSGRCRAEAPRTSRRCSRKSRTSRPTPRKRSRMRQRLQQAGFTNATPRQFWIVSGSAAGIAAFMLPCHSGRRSSLPRSPRS